jgi:hypothetical protein
MKNTIDAHVEFDYKGESHAPRMTLDLDALLAAEGAIPSIHALLAKANGIDSYSYQYEVMQDSDIVFDNAHGLAADYLINGMFDQTAFIAAWHDSKELGLLQPIAQRELGIADLAQHPELKNALLQAYRLGADSIR